LQDTGKKAEKSKPVGLFIVEKVRENPRRGPKTPPTIPKKEREHLGTKNEKNMGRCLAVLRKKREKAGKEGGVVPPEQTSPGRFLDILTNCLPQEKRRRTFKKSFSGSNDKTRGSKRNSVCWKETPSRKHAHKRGERINARVFRVGGRRLTEEANRGRGSFGVVFKNKKKQYIENLLGRKRRNTDCGRIDGSGQKRARKDKRGGLKRQKISRKRKAGT